jgi:hypothetical protein
MNGFFERLLRALVADGVEFVIVGGIAGRFHGSSLLTDDVDILYRRTRENIERLARALEPLHPRLRGADEGLPFIFDTETIRHGLNFTLSTDAGPIDCLGEISGIGGYDDAAEHAVAGEVFDIHCLFLSLDDLITAKRAAARRKDAEMLAQLEVIREELRRLG